MEKKFDREKLKKLIQGTTPYYENRRKINQTLSIGIGLLGIALSLGATLSGLVTENAKVAAAFGAGAATIQAILFAYPVDRRAGVYRVLAARNKNLWVELEVNQPTETELQNILEEFKTIQLQAAMEEFSSKNLDQPEDNSSNTSSTSVDANSQSTSPTEALPLHS